MEKPTAMAGFGERPEETTATKHSPSRTAANDWTGTLRRERGTKRVTGASRLSYKRAQHQKQRWFRRALRWRAGIERTLSHLKHPFSMARARYKGDSGFQRYVGWCVITKNLFSIARWQELKKLEPARIKNEPGE